jgi:hypothetical protein
MAMGLFVKPTDGPVAVANAVVQYMLDDGEGARAGTALVQMLQQGGVPHTFLGALLEAATEDDGGGGDLLPAEYVEMSRRVYNAAADTDTAYGRGVVKCLDEALAAAQVAVDDAMWTETDEEACYLPGLCNLVAIRSQLRGAHDMVFWRWAAAAFANGMGLDCASSSWSRQQEYELGQWFLQGVRHRLASEAAMVQVLDLWMTSGVQVHPSESSCFHDMACMVLAAHPTCKVWDGVVRTLFQDPVWHCRLCGEVLHAKSWDRDRMHPGNPGILRLAFRAVPEDESIATGQTAP